ncbi:Autophagy-related protein [Endocarpon pusillum Z07020]|uniref:Autophagy-related protein n=1 Tax=Endocarpon pusillum (strain Z07020 / HMAS-L-300199) TaxID=1263415 RepID=U1G566_ENDPU|nr:Autophagy-related protein [Endocarpon pusillum Z07020]ERF72477.1 Autophagy-related protein [Endocarpon pusillum Z07020]
MEREARAPGSHDPRYEDEDPRPTSRKELAGWYSYGWAAEVFAICAMASFLPITLEQLARDRGVQLHDQSLPCSSGWNTTSLVKDRSAATIRGSSLFHSQEEPPACVVHILGVEINTASFAMYTFSISVLVQTLIIISMSGAADHGRSRKTLLLAFAITGAVSTMLFLPVVPKVYLLGALLAIIANTCFGASFVLLNSFLPLLVRHHPSVQLRQGYGTPHDSGSEQLHLHRDVEEDDDQLLDPSSALLHDDGPDLTKPSRTSPAAISPELKLSTKISSNGIGIGYVAGLFVQSIAILLVVSTGSNTFSLRLVLFVIGSWWLLFTIPAALWLRPRPGPPLPLAHQTWLSYLTYAWKSLYLTILRARHLRDVVIFLAAWFLLSDGIATVSGTAILFAKTSLGMKPWALALINVISTIAGVFGAFSWSFFSRLLNLRASQTIIACICLFEIIPLYGLLGFIPSVRDFGMFGLQNPWEMYPLGAIYGFVLGGLSSYCRSFYGELIPPGSEAAFYALYAITDKGSSIFGPAIVGAITDHYGEIRPAFVFLAVLIAMPLPLMMLVDVERGKKDAREMAVVLEAKGFGHDTRRDVGYEAVPTIVLESEGNGN